MEKQFIPYEQALELKELGFNEPCFAIWSGFDENNFSATDTVRLFSSKFSIDGTQSNTLYINSTDNRVSAPLWQQGINFLLNKLNGHYCITFYKDETGYITDNRVDYLEYDFENFTECLKKLIEIIKRNTKSVGE